MEKERSVKLLIISILFMLIAGLTVAFAGHLVPYLLSKLPSESVQ